MYNGWVGGASTPVGRRRARLGRDALRRRPRCPHRGRRGHPGRPRGGGRGPAPGRRGPAHRRARPPGRGPAARTRPASSSPRRASPPRRWPGAGTWPPPPWPATGTPARCPRRPRPGPSYARLIEYLVGRRHRRVPADAGRGTGPRRRPAGARVAQGRGRPRHRVPGRHHRGGHVRHRRRPPPRPGGRALHDLREEPRRRGHLVRERLSGLPGGRPQPRLQLLLRPDRRLAAVLLHPGRAPGLLPDLPGPPRPAPSTSASAPRWPGPPGTRTRRPGRSGSSARTGSRRRPATRAWSAPWASSTGPTGRTSTASTGSPASTSTPPSGTTASTSPASGWPSSAPGPAPPSSSRPSPSRPPSWTSSSAPPRGSSPRPTYHDELDEGLRWVLEHVPGYARWDRLWLFWRTLEGLGADGRGGPRRGTRASCRSACPTTSSASCSPPTCSWSSPIRSCWRRSCPTTRPWPSASCGTTGSGPGPSPGTTSTWSPPASPRSPRRACAPTTASSTRPT